MEIREALAVPFEMMRAADGHPITVGTTDGDQVVLRIHSAIPAPDLTWPPCHVLATPEDLVRAATGVHTAVQTTDGEPMFLRIPTLEEYRATVDKGAAWFVRHDLDVPAPPTDAQILGVIRPLPIGWRP